MNVKWPFRKPITVDRESLRRRHTIQSQPVLGAGTGYEYRVCSNPFCHFHYKDDRFEWQETGIKHWVLRKEIQEQGFKLKQEYFKKYGDYGPRRERPENAGLLHTMRAYD